MKIGIIVHSKTGNTLLAAKKVMEKLTAGGHQVNVEQIKPVGDENEKNAAKIKLEHIPDMKAYDALIFASPVWGFTTTPVMKAFFNQIGSLKGQKTACFVTQLFPYPWMGGNSTINHMVKLCESKDAKVSGTGIVNWMGSRRAKTLNALIEKFGGMF